LSNPLCESVVVIKNKIMTTNEQLELGFNGIKPRANAARREGRIARANWWFAKMREAVAGAMDWQTQPEPRPEQIWMPGANREIKV
jgi:hypothetical protein